MRSKNRTILVLTAALGLVVSGAVAPATADEEPAELTETQFMDVYVTPDTAYQSGSGRVYGLLARGSEPGSEPADWVPHEGAPFSVYRVLDDGREFFSSHGLVSASGAFAFNINPQRTATWSLRYYGDDTHEPATVEVRQEIRPINRWTLKTSGFTVNTAPRAEGRVFARDVVLGTTPVKVPLDATMESYGQGDFTPCFRNISVEGRWASGERTNTAPTRWTNPGSGHTTETFRATDPVGLYEIGACGSMSVYTETPLTDDDGEIASEDFSFEEHSLEVFRLRRASLVTATANRTSLDEPGWVTLTGRVRKLSLAADGGSAAFKAARYTNVDVSWIVGSRPELEKTVKTDADGVYKVRVWTDASGTWQVGNRQNNVNATDVKKVRVTVG
ncbi:hypothetical protein GCM10010413_56380 [Promicromonospora sukumoe]|uniref:Uncharacterized protein n=1 Tax=Promicromonospora sukumoe TaxID=88382 RepID=A0A7W3JDI4_9MICO|nr:hypothetical protein [Promicromonospora sukumoe]MBA8810857.1 hypothetical protein [Promicromonospora sukumoe]